MQINDDRVEEYLNRAINIIGFEGCQVEFTEYSSSELKMIIEVAKMIQLEDLSK